MEEEEAKTPGPPRRAAKLTDEQRSRILELASRPLGVREISRQTGLGRKLVRRVLEEAGTLGPATPTTPASKLDPFREAIAEKVGKNLTVERILREIQEQGYEGGRTILREHPTFHTSKQAVGDSRRAVRRGDRQARSRRDGRFRGRRKPRSPRRGSRTGSTTTPARERTSTPRTV